jgi:ferric-dicitrate binding protein FerR (iron transport regulator)
MGREPLTPEEIEKLRALLPYAEAVRSEAEYDAAKRLVMRRWKGMVIAMAALAGALVVLWQHFKAFIQAVVGN